MLPSASCGPFEVTGNPWTSWSAWHAPRERDWLCIVQTKPVAGYSFVCLFGLLLFFLTQLTFMENLLNARWVYLSTHKDLIEFDVQIFWVKAVRGPRSCSVLVGLLRFLNAFSYSQLTPWEQVTYPKNYISFMIMINGNNHCDFSMVYKHYLCPRGGARPGGLLVLWMKLQGLNQWHTWSPIYNDVAGARAQVFWCLYVVVSQFLKHWLLFCKRKMEEYDDYVT